MSKTFFLFLLFASFYIECRSQFTQFEKIEYSSFDMNSYRTNVKDSVFVGLYCSISSSGLIQIKNPTRDSSKIHYSFQLSASELEKIKSIFNPDKKLKTYLVKTKLDKNTLYAGSYDFYKVTYPNGYLDSICIIVPFESNLFREIDNLLSDIFYSRKDRNKIGAFDIPIPFLTSLKSCYLKSKYLPAIENPPAFIMGNE